MFSRTDIPNKGFTLVEVMVSLAIMAIVMTVAFSGLRVGLSGWERGSKAIDELDQRETIERLIKQQVAFAYPMKVTIVPQALGSLIPVPITAVMFRGTSQRLEFISDYSLEDGPGDFRKIDYAVADGHFFYGEKAMFDYAPMEIEDPPTRQLATFKQVSFHFPAVDPQGIPIWIDKWDFGTGMPPAIQVRLDDDTFVVRMVNQ